MCSSCKNLLVPAFFPATYGFGVLKVVARDVDELPWTTFFFAKWLPQGGWFFSQKVPVWLKTTKNYPKTIQNHQKTIEKPLKNH